MFVITYTDGKFVKRTATKTTTTSSEHLADTFKTIEDANKFIDTYIPKKRRRYYMIQESNIKDSEKVINKLKPHTTKVLDKPSNVYDKLKELMETVIDDELIKLEKQIATYDDMILDIRHYIRDENTKFNTVYGYKVLKLLQDIERKRLSCKYEIARIEQLKLKLSKDLISFEKFEFEPYKPRVITNIDDYINGTKTI